jgi:hypothetical protein
MMPATSAQVALLSLLAVQFWSLYKPYTLHLSDQRRTRYARLMAIAVHQTRRSCCTQHWMINALRVARALSRPAATRCPIDAS